MQRIIQPMFAGISVKSDYNVQILTPERFLEIALTFAISRSFWN